MEIMAFLSLPINVSIIYTIHLRTVKSINFHKILKNACCNFPEPKVTSTDWLFCLNKRPKTSSIKQRKAHFCLINDDRLSKLSINYLSIDLTINRLIVSALQYVEYAASPHQMKQPVHTAGIGIKSGTVLQQFCKNSPAAVKCSACGVCL